MSFKLNEIQSLDLWRRTIVTSVCNDAPDLSARQMALLLTVYLTAPPHTVRGLAETLNISKPAVTRGLDRLGTLDLVRRKTDDRDRRSVLLQRTVRGAVFLREFGETLAAAAAEVSGGGEYPVSRRVRKTRPLRPRAGVVAVADGSAAGRSAGWLPPAPARCPDRRARGRPARPRCPVREGATDRG